MKFEMTAAAGIKAPFLLFQACSFFSSESTIDESEASAATAAVLEVPHPMMPPLVVRLLLLFPASDCYWSHQKNKNNTSLQQY